jgi:hypothetical protein
MFKAPATGLVATTTSPSYTLSGLTAGTPYAYVVEAIDGLGRTSGFAAPATFYTGTPAAGGSPTPTPTPTPTSTPPPGPLACSAAYTLVNSWSGGFQGQVTLTNTGGSAISPWTLTWTFPGDQKISTMRTAGPAEWARRCSS